MAVSKLATATDGCSSYALRQLLHPKAELSSIVCVADL